MAKRKHGKNGGRSDRQPDANDAFKELDEQADVQAQGSGTEEFAELEREAAVEQADTAGQVFESESIEVEIEQTDADGDAHPHKTPEEETPEDQAQHPGGAALGLKRRYFAATNAVYDYFYFVGIQLLRSTRSKRRHLLQGLHRIEAALERRNQIRRRKIEWYLHGVWKDVTAPLVTFRARYKEFRKDLFNARRFGNGRRVFSVCLGMAGFVFHELWKILKFLFNYAAPVAGIVVLCLTVQYYHQLTFALRVEYAGRDLGYIWDESVFNQAENEMKGRIINETYIKPDDVIPKFELSIVDTQQLVSVDELTNKLIQASGNELEEADGLYIQNQFVSAVTDGEALLLYMNDMLEAYRTLDMDSDAKIQFVKKVQVKHGLYPVSSVKPLEEVKELLNREEKGEKRYTVVSGDDGLTIAAKNGIPYEDLKALNPDIETSLFPGDEVLVSQSVPYLGVQVTTTQTFEEEIDYKIEQKTDATQNIGYTKVTQEGEKGLQKVTVEIVMIDGVEKERRTVNTEIVKPAVPQIVVVGGNKPLQVIPSTSSGRITSGAFGWPAAGGSITTGFMGYYGHTGSDITFSNCFDTPVYASADGTVVASGWGGLYGYRIIINHGGNVQTLYAHCNRLFVSVGQQVGRGEQIATIGRSGNATGPHLHFEIRINGTPVNAAPYLYG